MSASFDPKFIAFSKYVAAGNPEMVSNGGFDTSDGWSTTTMTISGGQVSWSSASPYGNITQYDTVGEGPMTPLEANTAYDLSFEVISYTGGSGAWMRFANSNNTVAYIDYAWYAVGVHTVGFTTPVAALDPNGLRILINNEEGCTAVVFDNVSIIAQ